VSSTILLLNVFFTDKSDSVLHIQRLSEFINFVDLMSSSDFSETLLYYEI